MVAYSWILEAVTSTPRYIKFTFAFACGHISCIFFKRFAQKDNNEVRVQLNPHVTYWWHTLTISHAYACAVGCGYPFWAFSFSLSNTSFDRLIPLPTPPKNHIKITWSCYPPCIYIINFVVTLVYTITFTFRCSAVAFFFVLSLFLYCAPSLFLVISSFHS